jgi:hypothetical protein
VIIRISGEAHPVFSRIQGLPDRNAGVDPFGIPIGGVAFG